jgi:glycosyltransferase involved in cell wall biosynthesis
MDRANFALASRLLQRGRELHVVSHRVAGSLGAAGAVIHPVWRPSGAHMLGMPLLAREGARHARTLAPRQARVILNGGNCVATGINWVHYVHAAYEPAGDASGSARVLARIQRRYVLKREREALAEARLTICNSARTQRDVIQRLGVDPARTRVLYYGTDPEQFHPFTRADRDNARRQLGIAPDRPVALFVGALGDRRKGFDALFAAWPRLDGDAMLVVAGTGREESAWRARARAASVEPRIRFLGYRHDVPNLLAAADVLVHPARYEAYGLSVHEAICCGVPAIVAHDAGAAERYPAALGPLVLRDITADAVRDAWTAWSGDRSRFQKEAIALGEQWRARSWDVMADEFISMVEEL